MALIVSVEVADSLLNISFDSLVTATTVSSFRSVVEVATSIELGRSGVVSREHILRVVVDKVALLVAQVLLGDEAGHSELLDDLQDVKLRVESRSGLCLKLVVPVVRVPAAEAPGRGEVLFTHEALHLVAEWVAPLDLMVEVLAELIVVLRNLRIRLLVVRLVVNIVVKFLGHGVVQGETLVSPKDVADEAEHNGEVGSEPLESVGNGFSDRAGREGTACCLELH